MDQYFNISAIFKQNPNLKGVSFKKKLPTPLFGAPYCGPFSAEWGVCQLAPIGPILKLMNHFPHKIQIEIGFVLRQKLQFMYLGPNNAGHLEQMGVSSDRPKIDQF